MSFAIFFFLAADALISHLNWWLKRVGENDEAGWECKGDVAGFVSTSASAVLVQLYPSAPGMLNLEPSVQISEQTEL